MILGDKKIIQEVENGNITISEFDKARINPASYDVLLGDEIAMYLPNLNLKQLRVFSFLSLDKMIFIF